MKKLSKNSAGFSVFEVLLVVVLVSIIGFVGWYVLRARSDNSNKNTQTNTELAKTITEKILETKANDPIVPIPKEQTEKDIESLVNPAKSDEYIAYKSPKGFAFKYPKSWDVDRKDWSPGAITLTSPSKGIYFSFNDGGVDKSTYTPDCQRYPNSNGGTMRSVKKVDIGVSSQQYLIETYKSYSYFDGSTNSTKTGVSKGVDLTDWDGAEPKVGEDGYKCNLYTPAFQTKEIGRKGWLHITSLAREYEDLSADKFFKLPEVEIVRQIILSAKYE